MPEHRIGSRVPDLGPRGEGWVVLQVTLLLAVVAAAAWGPPWPSALRVIVRTAGFAGLTAGAALALAGSRTLGRALTPLPKPAADASFRDEGAYRLVRHPIYGGVMMMAFGGSLLGSPTAVLPAALLVLLFEGKRLREERWLSDRYPEYTAYRERVPRRFLPFLW